MIAYLSPINGICINCLLFSSSKINIFPLAYPQPAFPLVSLKPRHQMFGVGSGKESRVYVNPPTYPLDRVLTRSGRMVELIACHSKTLTAG